MNKDIRSAQVVRATESYIPFSSTTYLFFLQRRVSLKLPTTTNSQNKRCVRAKTISLF